MIDEQTKQLIIDTARIYDVVSDFVQLRHKGAGFVGLCPFHKDRHPSFIVTPSKNICKCFACGAGGTPISFIMKIQNCSFVEALRYLAQKYNIPVPEREMTEEEQQRQSEREALYLANEVATKFFTEQLLSSEEGLDIALPYFTQRGVRSEAIQTFGLGYSPNDRRALVKYVEEHGYDIESFVATGLLYAPNEGRPSADRYHERVIFPIYNVGGRVVGFGGRTMRKADKIAKYINSPESIIYDKSRELYGLYQAKRAIGRLDQSIIVEGYLDVIAMHQVGIENVVATSGTALTESQIQLLRRFSRNVLVLFDGDEAGVKAALRSIDMLLAEGMQIKLLVLPDGEDPDEFVAKRSRTEVEEYFAAHEQARHSRRVKYSSCDASRVMCWYSSTVTRRESRRRCARSICSSLRGCRSSSWCCPMARTPMSLSLSVVAQRWRSTLLPMSRTSSPSSRSFTLHRWLVIRSSRRN